MRWFPALTGFACALLLTACTGGDDAADDGPATLTIWAHEGKAAEVAVLERQVAAFRDRHPEATVELVLVPEADYHAQVRSAAVAGKLPDLLDLDGPFVANYAWKGWLQPLDGHLPASLRDDLLPSLIEQGTWNDQLWCVGTFDSGLGLYVDTARLPDDVALPTTIEEAWDAETFSALLERLAAAEHAASADGAVLDLHLNYSGEWWIYAFAPVLWSAGSGLVDAEGRAGGTLDGPRAVRALGVVEGWIGDGLVDANTDDRAFVDRRVACSWSGHWDYPRYREALGEDLALVPLPDFGTGPRTGQGSWAWGMTAACDAPDLASAFLAFLLETDQVLAMTAANGAVPATHEAVAASPRYQPGKPLALFAEQLTTIARPRPVTPAYPVITDAFQQATTALRGAGDLEAALERAAATIDRDHADNRGYPVVE